MPCQNDFKIYFFLCVFCLLYHHFFVYCVLSENNIWWQLHHFDHSNILHWKYTVLPSSGKIMTKCSVMSLSPCRGAWRVCTSWTTGCRSRRCPTPPPWWAAATPPWGVWPWAASTLPRPQSQGTSAPPSAPPATRYSSGTTLREGSLV